MATIDLRNQEERGQEQSAQKQVSPLRARRRWPWFLLGALITLLLLVWFAPAIVMCTPLRDRLVTWAAADLNATATIGSGSLGWLSPVILRDVQVTDAAGQPMVVVPQATSGKTLLALLADPSNPGLFHIEQPKLQLVLREDGSNLEDALAAFWKRPKQEPKRIGLQVDVVDGQLTIVDAATHRDWQFDKLSAHVAAAADALQPIEIEAAGSIPQQPQPGRFSVKLKFLTGQVTAAQVAAAQRVQGAGDVRFKGETTLEVEAFPLAACQSLLRRLSPGSQLDGVLTARLKGQVEDFIPQSALQDPTGISLGKGAVAGEIEAANLVLGGPWLKRDLLQLDQLELPCNLTWETNQIRIEQLSVMSEIGEASCQGEVAGIGQLLIKPSLYAALDALARASGQANGQVDISRLAQLLPHALALREGTEVTSGEVRLSLTSQPREDGSAWHGELFTTRLEAVNQGQRIAWEQPLRVTLQAHQDRQGTAIDAFECKSDFLDVQGSGTLAAFRLAGTYDLNRLAKELGRFVDLEEVHLAGTGRTDVRIERTDDWQFSAVGEANFQQFALTMPGNRPWQEQNLLVKFNVSGQAPDNELERVEKASVTVESEQDRLVVWLRQPVDVGQSAAADSWPLDLTLDGQISRWLPRIAPWTGPLPGWDLSGKANVAASATCTRESIDLTQLQINAQALHVWGNSLYLDEPQATLIGKGRWTIASRRLEMPQVEVRTSAVQAMLSDVRCAFPAKSPWELSGHVALSGDLGHLQRWTCEPRTRPTWLVAGALQGQGNVQQQGPTTRLDLDATINQFTATPAVGTPISEPRVRLVTVAQYEAAADRLSVENLEVTAHAVQLACAGRIDQVATARNLTCQGRVDYDVATIQQLLQPHVGTAIQLKGRESRQFNLSGPLAAPGVASPALGAIPLERWKGQGEFGWQSANVYGLPIGPVAIQAQLANGVVQMSPLDLLVSEGHLRVSSQVALRPGPIELRVAKGKVLDQVKITPEMCNRGLMYIAPAFAGVAEAQGKFSMTLDGCRLPLENLPAGDASGKFIVHTVEIGPGPLLQELATLLGHTGTAKLTRESEVEFRMVEGRVYHRGLELAFPNLIVRTHGSVGLDQTLAIMVEMPVPESWIRGDGQIRETLRQQTIRVPVGGTLSHPKLDGRAVEQMAAEFVRNTAEGTLKTEIGKQLDKLFKLPK